MIGDAGMPVCLQEAADAPADWAFPGMLRMRMRVTRTPWPESSPRRGVSDHPLIVHLAHAGQISTTGPGRCPRRRADCRGLLPGPLTLVLPRRRMPAAVTGGADTIALRAPAHVRCALLEPSAAASRRPRPIVTAG